MTRAQDVLDIMIDELEVEAFTVPIYDGDRREQWLSRCRQVLAAIPNPHQRTGQALSFALGLALRGVPSELVLRLFTSAH